MNDKPLVSIIIPTYNRVNMLKIAIDSALKQNYENIEILVSDNASEDDTNLLMQEYISKYKNIRYIRREKNIGPVLNSKTSYQEISGKYVMFLPDDDHLVSETFITNAVKAMEENSNVVIVHGIVKIYHKNNDKYEIYSYNSKKITKGIDYFFNYHHGCDHITGNFALLRKETLDKTDLLDPKQEDHLYETGFYLYLFLYGDIYFLTDEIIGCFNFHYLQQTSFNVNVLSNFDVMVITAKNLIEEAVRLHPEYKREEIQEAVETHIADLINFNFTGLLKHISYKEAYKLVKKSKLIKEFPNVIHKIKSPHKFYFSIFSIYKDEKYFKITILGIQGTIKLKS